MKINKTLSLGLVSASAIALLGSFGDTTSANVTTRNINYMLPGDILTLDASMAADVNSIDLLENVDAGLVRWDPKAQVVNDLAKSIEVSKDGLTYNITLRDGLKWSNGDKLTAQDFVYGWQRTIDPKTGSEYAYALAPVANANDIMASKAPVSSLGIKSTDATHLTITLAQPTPYFEKLLTLSAYYPINQKFVEKVGKAYGSSSNTTLYNGPYKFGSKNGWNGSNKSFTIVKNDNFYDAKNVKAPGVTFQVITNPTTAINLYKSGKLDFSSLPTKELIAANKSNKTYKSLPAPRTDSLQYNQSGIVPALSNEKIREAINLATNRKGLIATAAPNFSVLSTVTPTGLDTVPNGQDFSKYAAQPYKYDASKAANLFKEGLKEIGKDSLTLSLEGDEDNVFRKAAVDYLKANLEKDLPGLTINENLVPSKQRMQDAQNGNYEIILTSWGADYNEPSDYLMNYVTGSSLNTSFLSNPDFDKAYKAATTTPDVLDANKRYSDYKDAEAALYKASNINPIDTEAYSLLMNPKLKGISTFNSAMIFDLRHAQIK
ncbi:peptide ABC transporter substrate-binding protein [Lactovum miscens]|uniref:Oligopeptide transport system substrate-binding protein n=1 Tax=Lactovum miscens TaxID=190387 RepID=A0A841C6U1_9LACT|nr:peptide ABC transporter substrate-binding protein [Lactovum miscens]MBB5888523.1 oligopeptide transport system substrate-binding protein [Lactovum miscens]